MKWYVYGTDAGTGQRVTLAVEHAEATGAVQAAISKRILVDYVSGGLGLRIRALALPLACAAAFLLGIGCGVFYWRHAAERAAYQAARSDESGLKLALGQANRTIAALQGQVTTREKAGGGDGGEGAAALDRARQQLAATEKELAGVRQRATELERAAQAAEGLQAAAAGKSLAAAQEHADQLEGQLLAQRKQVELQTRALAGLAKAKQELAAELDALKGQLLAQAAKAEAPAVNAAVGEEAAVDRPAAGRWALRIGYDQAADFLALQFDRKGTTTETGAAGTMVTTAVWTANAATMRVVHDAGNTRVYAATLTVALAADGPKDKLAENGLLVGSFMKVFAPGLRDAEAWSGEAVRELAGKDAGQRVMRLGEDYKVTAWNNGQGMYSWKVESPRGELGN